MPVTQIIQAVVSLGGNSAPPTPTNNDFTFGSGTENNWYRLGSSIATSSYNTATYTPYTYPGGQNEHTYNFTGSEQIISPNLKVNGAWLNNPQIAVNIWFYPTTNGVQLLGEYGQADLTTGYRYSMLEINTDNTISALFWNGSQTTSVNTINLNAWNHIYFAEIWTGDHYFYVNGLNTNGNPNYHRSAPSSPDNGSIGEYFAIGDSCVTSINNSGRFQGKIGDLQISDYTAPSTWDALKSKYGY